MCLQVFILTIQETHLIVYEDQGQEKKPKELLLAKKTCSHNRPFADKIEDCSIVTESAHLLVVAVKELTGSRE